MSTMDLANALLTHPDPCPGHETGAERSRRNAHKHGLTGAGLALPTEDQAELDARLASYAAALQPRDDVQAGLVRIAALASWRLDRIAQQERAALAHKVRQARFQFEHAELARVLDLGHRLMDDPCYRSAPDDNDENDPLVVAWRFEEPALIVLELAQTLTGCDWMIARWREIYRALEDENFLHYDNRIKLIRLLGKRPETLLEDQQVGDICLSAHMIHPEPWALIRDCFQTTIGNENRPLYVKRVEAFATRGPENRIEALNILRRVIDDQLIRLAALRDALEPLREFEIAECEARALFDDSKEGVLRRRYETACSRELHRALADLVKLQQAQAAAPPPPRPTPPSAAPKPSKAPASSLRNEFLDWHSDHPFPPDPTRAHGLDRVEIAASRLIE